MRFSLKLASLLTLAALSGCSSLNPFASKPDPKYEPVALTEFKPALTVRQLWSVSVGASGNYAFTPVVSGSKIYAAAADGSLVKIDAASGRADWRINAGSKLTAGVGAGLDVVAVAGEKGSLIAFDTNGKQLWKIQETSEILSAPVVASGLVIVRGNDNRISAYDAANGQRKWFLDRQLPALILRNMPGLLVSGDQVIAGLPGGRMIALNLANGSLRWEAVVGEPKGATELERVADVSGTPVLAGKDVCAVSYQGRVGCYDALSGSLRWAKPLSSEVGVAADERFVFATDTSATLLAYSRDSGASAWKSEKLLNRKLSTPVSFGKSVVAGDFAGFLHFLSREDGSLIGRIPTDGSALAAAPVVAGDKLVIQTKSGLIAAIAAE